MVYKFGGLVAKMLRKRADEWETHPYKMLTVVLGVNFGIGFIKAYLKDQK